MRAACARGPGGRGRRPPDPRRGGSPLCTLQTETERGGSLHTPAHAQRPTPTQAQPQHVHKRQETRSRSRSQDQSQSTAPHSSVQRVAWRCRNGLASTHSRTRNEHREQCWCAGAAVQSSAQCRLDSFSRRGGGARASRTPSGRLLWRGCAAVRWLCCAVAGLCGCQTAMLCGSVRRGGGPHPLAQTRRRVVRRTAAVASPHAS